MARTAVVSLLFLLLGQSTFAQEQDIYDYSSPKTYEIGGVTVTGAETRDRNAIKTITGLRAGKNVTIPGDQIPKAIKSLWRLRLFEDVQILQDSIVGDLIFLEILLKERPLYSKHSYKGVKKVHHEDLNDIVKDILTKGSIVTDDRKQLLEIKIKEYFVDKGFLDTEMKIREFPDKERDNAVRLLIDVDKKERVKIDKININGNTAFKDWRLRFKMKETKKKWTVYKRSKFLKEEYKMDKKGLIAFYNKKGYKNAKIVRDSIHRNEDGELVLDIDLYEGNIFHYRNITWKGNSKYSDEQLTNVLGIIKGDVFNAELLEKRLRFSLDGRDISSLYLDDGYLFFDIQPVEVAVENDSIDIEMRIYEGPQATIDKVEIYGNDRTHEHVIRRSIRTLPGKKFSRSDIIRSQRELSNLGYFNPETMDIQPQVNQERGTADIIYNLEEQPSDQLELSAGYGGFSGLIGTLGVTFNNFSIRNAWDRSKWNPVPQGDGQKLSLRAQSNSRFFRSFNGSFTEPWLFGTRPNSLTVGLSYSDFDYSTRGLGNLQITRAFAGLGRQLQWPDDFFSANTTLTLEWIGLDNYDLSQFFVEGSTTPINTGQFKNFSLRQVFTRSSVSEPIYPRRGSRVSLAIQLTPPYSLLGRNNMIELTDDEKADIAAELTRRKGPADPPSDDELSTAYDNEVLKRRFEYLEYHKWRFDAEWYYNIIDKLVLAASAKIGFLGFYNPEIGISPFERFELGGDGLSNQNIGITGKDIISLRGYETTDLSVNDVGGASIFDKFTLELRYPVSLNPSSTIYVHGFVQGGNAWVGAENFNPFELQRSAGGGLRVFLPMFGLLGFDYGWGFDKTENFGQFNIVLGFEPD